MREGIPADYSDGREHEAAFPDEPFPCPNCGQMLGPACRVCVACRQPVDLSQVAGPEKLDEASKPIEALPTPDPVRFPWDLFLILLGARFFAALALQRQLGFMRTSLLLGGVELLSATWVLFDAYDKHIPKPLRWALGSAFFWLLIFPWYLARRRRPQAACRFVEAEAGLLARALFFGLILVFFAGVVYLILNGPPPG